MYTRLGACYAVFLGELGEDCDQSSDCYGNGTMMMCTDGECGCISGYKEYESTAEFGETFSYYVASTGKFLFHNNYYELHFTPRLESDRNQLSFLT